MRPDEAGGGFPRSLHLADPTERLSVPCTGLVRTLVDSGLPRPEIEHVVVGPSGEQLGRPDLAYPDHLVGLELDSRRHHLSAPAFEADRARQNRLELQGWMILRYTWLQYTRTPNRIVTDVDAALRLRSS